MTKEEKLTNWANEFLENCMDTCSVEEYDSIVKGFVRKLKRFAKTLK